MARRAFCGADIRHPIKILHAWKLAALSGLKFPTVGCNTVDAVQLFAAKGELSWLQLLH
jgi:hypothetical protein